MPAALAGWYLALFIGMFLLGFAESLCPPEDMVSGACLARWFDPVQTAIIYFSASLAAFLVVLFPTWMAPSHRNRVARSAFSVGALVAAFLAWSTLAWGEFIAAIIAGLLAVLLIKRWSGSKLGADRQY